MYPNLSRIAVLALVALLVAGAAGCGGATRMYDGPKLSKEQRVRLRASDAARVRVIDGEEVSVGGIGYRTFELRPGPHRIEAQYNSSYHAGPNTTVTETGYNYWTLDHDFEPGRTYEVREASISSLGNVVVLAERDEKGDLREVARPTLAPAEPDPPAGGEGSVVIGVAGTGQFNATGRPVYLLPDTPEVRAWAAEGVGTKSAESKLKRRVPNAQRKRAQRQLGYGLGYFEFRDVRRATT